MTPRRASQAPLRVISTDFALQAPPYERGMRGELRVD